MNKQINGLEVMLSNALQEVINENKIEGKQIVFAVFPDNQNTIIKPISIDKDNKAEGIELDIKGQARRDFTFTELVEMLLGKNVVILNQFMPMINAMLKPKKDVGSGR